MTTTLPDKNKEKKNISNSYYFSQNTRVLENEEYNKTQHIIVFNKNVSDQEKVIFNPPVENLEPIRTKIIPHEPLAFKKNNVVSNSDWLANIDLYFKEDITTTTQESLLKEMKSGIDHTYKDLFNQLIKAVSDYEGVDEKFKKDPLNSYLPLQPRSIKTLVTIIPLISGLNPEITVDPDTGFPSVLIKKGKFNMLFSTSARGHIHFSVVGKGKQIIKTTGIFKSMNKDDLFAFERVLHLI